MSAAAVIAILALVGGGAAIAAQSALPGHLLYPVKLGVNVKVREALASTDEAKAKVEADEAQNRLEEAEEVSVQEEVSADVRADIEANFKAFADRAQDRIKALTDTDARVAADIASNFETALGAHEKVLARLSAQDGESSVENKDLEHRVDSELSDTVKLRMAAEAAVRKGDHTAAMKEAAQGKLKAAGNVIAEVSNFIDMKKDQLGADAVVKAQAELTSAQSLLAQAQAKLDSGDYTAAFNMGNAVIRTSQGAKLLIEAQEELEVDLHLGGRPSTTPSVSPRPTPRTEGLIESETHVGTSGASSGTSVHVDFGF